MLHLYTEYAFPTPEISLLFFNRTIPISSIILQISIDRAFSPTMGNGCEDLVSGLDNAYLTISGG